MSTLLTSMETIVEEKPWLDRPRKAAKFMAISTSLLGLLAGYPWIVGAFLILPLFVSVPGYALCAAYWRIAKGNVKDPSSLWKTSMAYNGLLTIATSFIIATTAQDGNMEGFLLSLAALAWQLLAIHVSLRGLRAAV
ncbi:MAG: hypothetical protein ACKO2G_12980 [Verrucomicrobiales bacterium]